MKSKNMLVVALILALCASMTACQRHGDGAVGPANHRGTPAAKSPSTLGDLKQFRQIADDVAHKAGAGDLAAAKLRIKDLEIAWDEAEAGLKPRAAADWHKLDKAIDGALAALRAQPQSAEECGKKLTELLQTFDALD